MRPGKALAALAVYHVAQNVLLNERGYVAGNAIATGVGLAWARTSGLGWREMGMSRENLEPGLGLGAGVAAAASGLLLLTRDGGRMRAVFDDARLDEVSDRELWYRLLVRFPLGTALFEEVWFRGVLPAAMRQHGASRPELASAAAFAVWHLIPTARAIRSNKTGRTLRSSRSAALVVAGSAAAGIAGLGFAALGRMSSSLAAPWMAHAAINGLTLFVGLKQRRATRSRLP